MSYSSNAKSETKKIPFNLNSIAEIVVGEKKETIVEIIEGIKDVYLVTLHELSNVHYVYKTTNQVFNCPDFMYVMTCLNYEEVSIYIKRDMEHAKNVRKL
tara:strand:- start:204 stop:503 length:300 start_codon:yes stop_codon:yes gene_type:complete